MACIHGLQHVKRFAATTLPNHNSVRAHTKRVLDEVSNRDLATTLDVGRSGLHAQHVVLMELEFLGVLDGDNTFITRNERRQHIEQCRLSGTGSTRDNDVELADNTGLKESRGMSVQRSEPDQVVNLKWIRRELSNRQKRSPNGQWRNHRVHTGAVWESSIDHWCGFINSSTNSGNDLVDHPPKMCLVEECR